MLSLHDTHRKYQLIQGSELPLQSLFLLYYFVFLLYFVVVVVVVRQCSGVKCWLLLLVGIGVNCSRSAFMCSSPSSFIMFWHP